MIAGLPAIGGLEAPRQAGRRRIDRRRRRPKATGGKAKEPVSSDDGGVLRHLSTISGRLVYLGFQSPDLSGARRAG